MKIAGRLVLVTGASSGIGAATAKLMARKGARLLLMARTRPALEQVAADIRRSGGSASVYPADLSDASAVSETARIMQSEVGVPDILINNAGAGRWLWMEETSSEEAVAMMTSPYFAAFNITRAVLPEMLRRGSGHIVNLTSPAGFIAWPGCTAYTVARWAMRGFSEALRSELRGTGMHVTLVVPGLVRSAYFEHNPGGEDRVPGITKLFRKLLPDDVAAAILRGVERERREVIIPLEYKLALQLHRVLPRTMEWVLLKTSARRPTESSL